jgi:hypothetical protein
MYACREEHFITGQGHLLNPMPSVTITYSYSKVGYVCLQGGTLYNWTGTFTETYA